MKWLMIWASLLSPMAWAAEANQDPIVQNYLSAKQFFSKFPAVSREGITLPKALLLDKLKASVKTEHLNVEDLVLTPKGGTLIVHGSQYVQAKHRVHFNFLPVDWKNKTVPIRFKTESSAVSDSVLGKMLGTMAIHVMSAAVNTPVEALSETLPYLSLNREKGIAWVRLDRVPSLADVLNTSILGYRPFDSFGISELKTVQDGVLIRLGSDLK